jgi:hypothetical protein
MNIDLVWFSFPCFFSGKRLVMKSTCINLSW